MVCSTVAKSFKDNDEAVKAWNSMARMMSVSAAIVLLVGILGVYWMGLPIDSVHNQDLMVTQPKK